MWWKYFSRIQGTWYFLTQGILESKRKSLRLINDVIFSCYSFQVKAFHFLCVPAKSRELNSSPRRWKYLWDYSVLIHTAMRRNSLNINRVNFQFRVLVTLCPADNENTTHDYNLKTLPVNSVAIAINCSLSKSCFWKNVPLMIRKRYLKFFPFFKGFDQHSTLSKNLNPITYNETSNILK